MSSQSASFWAEKRKATATGPSEVQEPSPANSVGLTPSPKKLTNTLVLKRKEEASNNIATKPSSFRWDEDEDEEVTTSTIASAGPDHQQRIGELEDLVNQKDGRIAMLEDLVEEKNNRIEDLETILDEKKSRIGEMEDENHRQYLYTQELVEQLDEKDRRVSQLELAASDEETAQETINFINATLEELGSASSTSITLVDTKQEQIPTEAAVGEDATTLNSPTLSTDQTPNPEAMSTSEVSLETFPQLLALDPLSPTPRDAKEPIFATSDTIKKASPVPPPPTLKLGIDMSRYGKKSESKMKSSSEAFAGKRTASSNAHSMPSIDPDRDIRRMTREEREPYGKGPVVVIRLGDQTVGTVPQYILMQCSAIACQHWTKNPDAKGIQFPPESMDKEAAMQHVDWMQQHTRVGRVFSLNLDKNNTDRQNLQLVRAARVLGLNNIYIGHFTKQYCDKIRAKMPSYELMDLVEEMYYPGNDPIFDCLANNLSNQRLKDNIPDATGFEAFLATHPKLAAKIQEVDRRHGRNGKMRRGTGAAK